ncbi:hypothetical protein Vretifemale_11305, partial [Volvox reticuliferus]
KSLQRYPGSRVGSQLAPGSFGGNVVGGMLASPLCGSSGHPPYSGGAAAAVPSSPGAWSSHQSPRLRLSKCQYCRRRHRWARLLQQRKLYNCANYLDWPISQGGRGVIAARGAGRVSYSGIGGAEASVYVAVAPSAWLGIDALQCWQVDETAACKPYDGFGRGSSGTASGRLSE